MLAHAEIIVRAPKRDVAVAPTVAVHDVWPIARDHGLPVVAQFLKVPNTVKVIANAGDCNDAKVRIAIDQRLAGVRPLSAGIVSAGCRQPIAPTCLLSATIHRQGWVLMTLLWGKDGRKQAA